MFFVETKDAKCMINMAKFDIKHTFKKIYLE